MELLAFVAVFLMLAPKCAEAIGDMNICYILDGILVFFGVILTVLYCQLMISMTKTEVRKSEEAAGGIYEGLASQSRDIYETIKVDKKNVAS